MAALIFLFGLILGNQPVQANASDVVPNETQPENAINNPTTQPTGAEIADHLSLVVGDNSEQAREIGAKQLIRLGTTDALGALAQVLEQSENPRAIIAVCSALSTEENPPPVLLDQLIRLVATGAGELQRPLYAALAGYKPETVVDRLAAPLHAEETSNVQKRSLVAALGFFDDGKKTAMTVAALMSSDDAELRNEALRVFEIMSCMQFDAVEDALKWWERKSTLDDREWLEDVSRRRRNEIDRLRSERTGIVKKLADATRELYLAAPATEKTVRLIGMLKNELPSIRTLGLDVVDAMVIDQKEVPPEVRAELLNMLNDPRTVLRRRAAVLAGNLRIEKSHELLIAALAKDSDNKTRVAIAGALGRLDDVRAIEPLIATLDSGNADLIGEATLALGNLARKGRGNNEDFSNVAKALIASYEKLGPTDHVLRLRILQAMSRIGDPKFREIFDAAAEKTYPDDIRVQAILGLALVDGPGTADHLIGLLSDKGPMIRAAAASALGQLGRELKSFNALVIKADEPEEMDANVRDKAWAAAREVFKRLSGADQISTIDKYEAPDEITTVRRRITLARSLKADRTTFEALSVQDRLKVNITLGELLLSVDEFGEALVVWLDADLMRSSNKLAPDPAIDAGIIRAAAQSEKPDTAISRIISVQASGEEGASTRAANMLAVFEESVSKRTNLIDSADAMQNMAAMLTAARAQFESEPGFVSKIDELATSLERRRSEVIEMLIEKIGTDKSAEDKLVKFDPKLVTRHLGERLKKMKPTTSGPVIERETALIAFGKRLKPEWGGYQAGDPEEKKLSALQELIAQ